MAAPAPAPAPQLVLDAHADTLDHVVRAVARSGFLPEAVRLMLASREHLHDPELLYRTRTVRGVGGSTLLIYAVLWGHVARAAEILDACPTPAARAELLACVDDGGYAALHLASSSRALCEATALRVVELLLTNGADVLAHPRSPKTGLVASAIHFATRWSARLVQRLVQAGASIDGGVEGTSTLLSAARAGTAKGVRMIPQLVALGAREALGNEAMLAFSQWPVEGAQPTDGEVVAALSALVSVGCSLTQHDAHGLTPLDHAAHYGNAPVVRALLSLGVPATATILAHGVKYPAIVRVLLAAGAPPDELVDVRGAVRSPLMEAVRESTLESVEVLLAAGASAGLSDEDGGTALMLSVTGSAFDSCVTEALLAAGADVNAQASNGWAVLHILAAFQAQRPWAAGAARLLLQRGADARAVDIDGGTPAQCVPAVLRGGELHRLLLEAAAA